MTRMPTQTRKPVTDASAAIPRRAERGWVTHVCPNEPEGNPARVKGILKVLFTVVQNEGCDRQTEKCESREETEDLEGVDNGTAKLRDERRRLATASCSLYIICTFRCNIRLGKLGQEPLDGTRTGYELETEGNCGYHRNSGRIRKGVFPYPRTCRVSKVSIRAFVCGYMHAREQWHVLEVDVARLVHAVDRGRMPPEGSPIQDGLGTLKPRWRKPGGGHG